MIIRQDFRMAGRLLLVAALMAGVWGGAPVVTPHYAGVIASLRPQEAAAMWAWLIAGPFSPLNNVESLLFEDGAPCTPAGMTWNDLKGSWNLALQTLGLGIALAQRSGQVPVIWGATLGSPHLRRGYAALVPDGVRLAYLPLVMRE